MGVSKRHLLSKKYQNPINQSEPKPGLTNGLGGVMKADQVLVNEVKEGSRKAFSELVRRHQVGLLRLGVRMTKDRDLAEDIVQDSFFKAYQKIDSFEGRSSFKSWLYQIAVNTARNKLRARKREMVSIENVQLNVDAKAEIGMIMSDLHEIVQNEVAKLPHRQKTALVLRIFEDLSFKEISVIMDCPYDTAKANYRHALMKLKAKMTGERFLQYLQELNGYESRTLGRMLAEANT